MRGAGPDGLRIRAMNLGDLDRVAAIAGSLATAPQWPREAYAMAIEGGGIPQRIALVAEVDGEVLGFAVASVVQPQAEVESIAVAADAQGQGIGSALLTALVDAIRLASAPELIPELMLEVRASNLPAIRLYTRAGFCEAGRRRGYYAHPAEDAVLLQFFVSPA
jgi:ribosomal-protein-alanine N-acetyltransferase